jgi:hypothetical protein
MMYLSGTVREELINSIENLRQDRKAETILQDLLRSRIVNHSTVTVGHILRDKYVGYVQHAVAN